MWSYVYVRMSRCGHGCGDVRSCVHVPVSLRKRVLSWDLLPTLAYALPN